MFIDRRWYENVHNFTVKRTNWREVDAIDTHLRMPNENSISHKNANEAQHEKKRIIMMECN